MISVAFLALSVQPYHQLCVGAGSQNKPGSSSPNLGRGVVTETQAGVVDRIGKVYRGGLAVHMVEGSRRVLGG